MTTLQAADHIKFGIFLAPFHPVGQNPTLALERDLQLIEHLDALGFDEAWFGEHHSAGYEIIASPEVFIAAAAQRTKHIRLGTGVSSLPYHHPFMLADRLVLLDHLTRGRLMIGVGPGALPSDAFMMGIDPAKQRDMMEESLEAILLLLEGNEPVTMETDWFKLVGARLQTAPVPASLPRSGRGGAGLTGRATGGRQVRLQPALHRRHLGRRFRRARARTGTSWRSGPRSSTPWSIAASGAWSGPCTSPTPRSRPSRTWPSAWRSGSTTSSGWPPSRLAPDTTNFESLVDALNASGFAVHRHGGRRHQPGRAPADPVQGLRHLPADGTRVGRHRGHPPLLRAHRPLRGPEVPGQCPRSLTASRDWAAENRPQFIGAAGNAVMSAIQKHHEEKAAKSAHV